MVTSFYENPNDIEQFDGNIIPVTHSNRMNASVRVRKSVHLSQRHQRIRTARTAFQSDLGGGKMDQAKPDSNRKSVAGVRLSRTHLHAGASRMALGEACP
jgi:hypothetical protein